MSFHWLLVWLQALTLLAALVLRTVWRGPCGSQGSHACLCDEAENDSECLASQSVFRTEASASALYVLLAIMCAFINVSRARPAGCLAGVVVLPLVLSLLITVSLFVPSVVFEVFTPFVCVMSAVFRVLQNVLFMDFAYDMNELSVGTSFGIRRTVVGGGCVGFAAIIIVSALLFLTSVITSVMLVVDHPPMLWIVVPAMTISLASMAVSITEWCQHGSLLTSCVVLSYVTYLCVGAEVVRPTGDPSPTSLSVHRVFSVIFAACSLTILAAKKGVGRHIIGSSAYLVGDGASDAYPVEFAKLPFLSRCGVHFLACTYISDVLVLRASLTSFVVRVVTIFATVAIYGWTLVSPRIFSERFVV